MIAACGWLVACSSADGSPSAAGHGGAAGQAGLGGAGGWDVSMSSDAGPRADGAVEARDAGGDADMSGTDAGPWAVDGWSVAFTPGAPIDAPAGQWTFVGFDDAVCANGTPTGFAIKPAAGASAAGLFIFLAGGGACWDAETCLNLDAAVHLHDTVDASVAIAEANGLAGLFDQTSAINPFKDYAFVYVPYCTGDLHSGTGAATYQGSSGPVTLQHAGGHNLDAYLARLVPTFAAVPRVIVAGGSAGGFGATLNWWRVQAMFDEARVDVWDDGGLLVDPLDTRFANMTATWGTRLPPGCADCGARLSAWLPHYASKLTAPRRYALTGYLGDAVIGAYFSLPASEIETRLLALRAGAAANQKTFFLSGTLHSALADGIATTASDGASIVPWLFLFERDDASWNHAGP